jgi:NAD(P)-dependent dehydrogenase (short-subunit alcohol dehydrogenase family)
MSAPDAASFAGRRVLVTGASRGIGRAVARALMDRGARVALVARDATALDAARGGASGHVTISADLSDLGAVESVADRAAERLGGLDALVNNAGVVEYTGVGAIDRASLERQLTVNFTAPFLLAQRAAEHIRRAGGGAIVNVASTLALAPAPRTAAYAASKAALVSMTRSFALELAAQRIRVNAVAAGVIDTDMVHVPRTRSGEAVPTGAAREARVASELEALRGAVPAGRLGAPEDVAHAVLYLLTADYVTGAVLTVDGGLLLAGADAT